SRLPERRDPEAWPVCLSLVCRDRRRPQTSPSAETYESRFARTRAEPALPSLANSSSFAYSGSLVNSGQCHVHRRHPGLSVATFVVTHQLLPVVCERPCTPYLGSDPAPGRSLDRQLLARDVALAVVERGAESARFDVEADHLDAAHAVFSDRAVGGVEDEESAGSPFIDVARGDRSGRRAVAPEGVPRRHPSSDECIERSIFRPRRRCLSGLARGDVASVCLHVLLLPWLGLSFSFMRRRSTERPLRRLLRATDRRGAESRCRWPSRPASLG